MRRLLEHLVRILDRRILASRGFARYVVTPRQGRQVVRRRLLRSLRRRMATRALPCFNANAEAELTGRAARQSTLPFKLNRHAT